MRSRLSRFIPVVCAAFALGLACAPAAGSQSKSPPVVPVPPGAVAPPPAAAAPTAAPQAQAEPGQRATVRFGGVSGTIDRALWTGEAKGFYEEQGIALEVETFTSTVDMVAPLATGRLDAGHGAINAGFFNAVATGVPLRLVSNMSVLRLPSDSIRNSYQVVVRRDLAGQVRSVADLRGKKLAINGPAAQVHAWRALTYGGLQLEDVQIENISFPEQLAALSNQAIDAALAIEPLVTAGRDRGILEPLLDLGQAMPDYPVAMVFYAEDFIKVRPDVARRFLVAYVKSLRYLEDAVTKKQNWNEVVQLFIANTPVKDAAVYERMADSYQETDGRIAVDALEVDQDFYLQHGMQKDRLNVRALVDPRFAENAIQVLGPYQR